MRRISITVAFLGVFGSQAIAVPASTHDVGKAQFLNESQQYETAIRDGEASNATPQQLAPLYDQLGSAYECLGWYPRAEAALKRAVSLLQDGPQDQLAQVWAHLAVLHIATADLRQADKDEAQGLRIREAIGDPIGLALTWTDIAQLNYRERHFQKSLDYAQRAMAVLETHSTIAAESSIGVRNVFAYALCQNGRCSEATPIIKDALRIAQAHYGPDSLPVALATYSMGYIAWRNKQMDDAARFMGQGIARMKVDLGWGNLAYVNSLRQYREFLKETRQKELEASVDRELQTLTTTVDVRSLASMQTDQHGPA